MRKFFPYILILVVVTAVFIPASITHAQQPPDVGVLGTATSWVGGTFLSALNIIFSNISGYILSPLFYLIQKVLALFMGLAGLILNYTITETVVEMGENISTMSGINNAWRVLRDLMNIGFIFMLVYQGILMIIGQSDVARVRKFIVGIVLASLLINFSLFFTKILIDASNIITIGMYNSIMGQIPNAGTGNTTGLSNAFQQSLGLQGFFSADTIQVGNSSGGYGQLVANLMACILFVITIFVFLAVSVLFIVRFIVLIILLALSPIAYMGLAGLPGIATHSKKWWDSLWGQLIFGPVYMLMTWVILTFIRSPGFFGSNLNPQDLARIQNASSVADLSAATGLIFNFAIVIGLTIASLVVAKSTATQGASQIGKLSAGATTFAGGALFGSAAWAGRNTFGRMALRGTSAEELKARADQGDLSARARLSVAKGSFDVRRSYAGEKISKATGIDLGKGSLLNPEAGKGGMAASKASYRKEIDSDQDNIITNYTKKRDWSGLASYTTNKPSYITQAEWENRQKYVYKKLNARDKIDFERALGLMAGGPALVTKLRDKLPLDEQVKIYTDRKDWAVMASWIMTKNPQDQLFIYEKMSARDRIELNGELTAAGTAGASLVTTLNSGLSAEEQEKTRESDRKARKANANTIAVNAVNHIATGNPNPATGAPYTQAEIATLVARMPDSAARDLDPGARIDPNINVHFRSKHLADLMSNAYPELTNAEAVSIKTSIEAAHPSNHPVVQWLNNPTRVADWS